MKPPKVIQAEGAGGEGDRPQQADAETEAPDTAIASLSFGVVTLELHRITAIGLLSKESMWPEDSTEIHDQ